MAQYWDYLRWGLYAASALSAGRLLPLAAVRLVAAFTRSEERHKHCMEVLRLARHDAAHIPPYIYTPSPAQALSLQALMPGPHPTLRVGLWVRSAHDSEKRSNVETKRWPD
jgi:hypothetical protein